MEEAEDPIIERPVKVFRHAEAEHERAGRDRALKWTRDGQGTLTGAVDEVFDLVHDVDECLAASVDSDLVDHVDWCCRGIATGINIEHEVIDASVLWLLRLDQDQHAEQVKSGPGHWLA